MSDTKNNNADSVQAMSAEGTAEQEMYAEDLTEQLHLPAATRMWL